jgi:hypothetical protein
MSVYAQITSTFRVYLEDIDMSQERHVGRADQQAVAQFSGAEITAVRSGEDELIYASLSQ